MQKVTSEKFYVVESELKEHRRTQDQMASIQRNTAQLMITQLQIFKNSVYLFGQGDQKIHICGELTHNVAVLNSVLSCIHSTLKIRRASPYTFRTNISTASAPIVNGFLPLSVSPKSALQKNILRLCYKEVKQVSASP